MCLNKLPAVLLKVPGATMHRYMQQYPYASGPDEAHNRQCLEILRASITFRNATHTAVIPEEGEASFSDEELRRATVFLTSLGQSPRNITRTRDDFVWRVKPISPHVRTVLSLGCGDGSELAVLRVILPHARIDAIDWVQKISPRGVQELGVNFEVADFNDLLSVQKRQYDVIFTNHVLEHLYDPDATLQGLRQWLQPGGVLVSALPLDADPQRPYVHDMMRLLESPDRIRLTDLDLIDLGHPWKTNLEDVCSTMHQAGFSKVRLLQRTLHVSRMTPGGHAACRRMTQWGRMAGSLVFGLPRTALKLHGDAPLRARKILYGLETRLLVGRSRLKNLLAPEVLAVATNSTA